MRAGDGKQGRIGLPGQQVGISMLKSSFSHSFINRFAISKFCYDSVPVHTLDTTFDHLPLP